MGQTLHSISDGAPDRIQKPILGRTGLYVPLYAYPEGVGWITWKTVINAKISHPSVPFVVTINPDNGAGSSKDNNFVDGINKLKEAGIVVLGYVYTNYGVRNNKLAKVEIRDYKTWYNVDGIMFDEMPNKAGFEDYYYDLNCFSKSLGMTFAKGNPGTDISSSYIGILDNLAIYETSGYPPITRLAGWHTNYNKANWSYCSYGITNLDSEYVRETSRYVGLLYITDDTPPNPYDVIPNYFENLVSILGSGAYL